MTGFIIGLITTAAVIAFAEIFRKIDLKFYASLNLAVIPFIYIGFSVEPHHTCSQRNFAERTYGTTFFGIEALDIVRLVFMSN